MSNTRYARPDADPEASNERNLASSKLRGLNIGLNVIAKIGRTRPLAQRRAMVWLFNFAKIQGLTADELSDRLDLDKAYIRTVLTDPSEDATRFTSHVAAIRKEFEAGIPDIVDTEVAQTVREGIGYAVDRKKIVEIIGDTRMGKTEAAWNQYLRIMDRGVMLLHPGEDESDRSFIWNVARALGIGVSTAKKTVQLRPQISGCFGPGLLEFIIVDEAHFLWPQEPKSKPKRVEFLRSLWDKDRPTAIGVCVLATPQYTASSEAASCKNERWAPGQWDGRVTRYHLKNSMSDKDLMAIARYHAPGWNASMHDFLVLMAKATEGYCGAMVNCIDLAKDKADRRKCNVSMEILTEAARQQVAGTRLQKLTEAMASKKVR